MPSQTVYVAIWADRHTDVMVTVFASEDTAIKFAQEIVDKYSDGDADEELTDLMKDAGWLYCGCYSSEGDSIRVVSMDVKP